jgi:peptide/nickel transport system substrate-binding protein
MPGMWTRRQVLAGGVAITAATLLPMGRSFAATDQLRIAIDHEPSHLDPTLTDDAATQDVTFQNIFEGLTRLDESGAVQPGLARSWTTSPDGLSLTFALQPDVRFHDGTAFDASHAVFSIKRLLAGDSASPHKALYAAIGDVVAPNPATVTLTLRQADAQMLHKLALADAVMVAPESAFNNRAQPIGTGPFDLLEWDNGKGIALERNEDYWGVHPLTTQVDIYFIADAQAALASLADGGIDGYPNFPDARALAPLAQSPAFRITRGKGPGGKPRLGIWNTQLTGMWSDVPVEGCVLSGIHWASDTTPPQVGPSPYTSNPDD